jgi:hypothetical protein
MNGNITQSNRGIVVIVDPHIKAVDSYFVFSEGNALVDPTEGPGNYTNIFI